MSGVNGIGARWSYVNPATESYSRPQDWPQEGPDVPWGPDFEQRLKALVFRIRDEVLGTDLPSAMEVRFKPTCARAYGDCWHLGFEYEGTFERPVVAEPMTVDENLVAKAAWARLEEGQMVTAGELGGYRSPEYWAQSLRPATVSVPVAADTVLSERNEQRHRLEHNCDVAFEMFEEALTRIWGAIRLVVVATPA